MVYDDSSPLTWSEDSLLQSSRNFCRVPRISATESLEVIIAKIHEHEDSGVPLIVEGWNKRSDWDFGKFSVEGFLEEPQQSISVRNVKTGTDVQMQLDELIAHYQCILKEDRLQENILYGKDLPCPQSWSKWLRDTLPAHCHPLGPNDMLSHLLPQERPETLMCYIGTGETFTAAHKDPCGSFGHNIMCYTSHNSFAFWFMSETGKIDEDVPAQYFRTHLNTDLDLESHKLTIEEFRKAPFTVYCAEQHLGDLVLVPPRSCHQVVNAGGITIKMSWSRMGLKSLQYSLHSELLFYHRVCRPEVYRVKLTVFRVLQAYTTQVDTSSSSDIIPIMSQILHLFDRILVEEWALESTHLTIAEIHDSDSAFTLSCDFCGADIFQSFFACSLCSDSDGTNTYTCCPNCYVEGRSCQCGSEHLQPCQALPFGELVEERKKAAIALNRHSNGSIQLNWSHNIAGSSHIPIFQAACLYHKQTEMSINLKREHLTCSNVKGDIWHELTPKLVIRCPPCHRNICFLHALELFEIHSAEALLIYQHGCDEWHNRHRLKPDEQGTSLESVRLYHGDHSKRLLKAAMNFPDCRPLDSKRSQPGFYDITVYVKPNSEGSDAQSPGFNRIVGDDGQSLTPLSDLEEMLRIDPPSASALSLLTPPSSQSSSSGKMTSGTLRPNSRKRPFVDIPRLSSRAIADPLPKRLKLYNTTSTSLSCASMPARYTQSPTFLLPNDRPSKYNTVAPLSAPSSPTVSLSLFSSPAQPTSPQFLRGSGFMPLKVGPPNRYLKKKQEAATTSVMISETHKTPSSSSSGRYGKLNSTEVSRKTVRRVNTNISTSKNSKTVFRNTSRRSHTDLSASKIARSSIEEAQERRTPNRTLSSPIASASSPILNRPAHAPTPQQPKKNITANSLHVGSIYKRSVKELHPGNVMQQNKLIADYVSADDPALFLALQMEEVVDTVKRSKQEQDRLSAEVTAARLQMSYMTGSAYGQSSSSTERQLGVENRQLKEENEELKGRLQLLERIKNPQPQNLGWGAPSIYGVGDSNMNNLWHNH